MAKILVDTSVWVDHFRNKNEHLIRLLKQNQVLMHPMIRGELACGNLHQRIQILSLLNDLPKAPEASHDEVLIFLEKQGLMGKGVGFIDLHLLVSTLLAKNALLWTKDRRLNALSLQLKLGWVPPH